MSLPKLFTPFKLGGITLQHRVVLAPLTRNRADIHHVPTPMMAEYYAQRASTPGTLLITEATVIAPQAGGYKHVPGIWNEAQVAAWKRVTDAVHAQSSFIYCQLWAIGRAAEPEVLEEGGFSYVSSSAVQLPDKPVAPRPLTVDEIQEYVKLFADAAKNAIRAGFDGVEIHGANGYLVDQFIQDVSNKRTDEYGGSIEKRARFALEVVASVAAAVGEDKTAIRFSPWETYGGMRMTDPRPSFSHVVSELAKRHPNLSYIHLIESRVTGIDDRESESWESNDFLREIWAPKPFMSAGGYNRDLALEVAEAKGDLTSWGRYFLANPDLPTRLQKDIPFGKGDRSTYYLYESETGYIDYPFADGTIRPAQFKL